MIYPLLGEGLDAYQYSQIIHLLNDAELKAALNPEEYCRCIIRSIPLLLRSHVGTFCQHLVPFPFHIVLCIMVGYKSQSDALEAGMRASIFVFPKVISA